MFPTFPKLTFDDDRVFPGTRDMAEMLPEEQQDDFRRWANDADVAMTVVTFRNASESADTYSCLECGKPASIRCPSCAELPIVFISDVLAYYCSSACKKKNRKQHRSACNKLVRRKALYRAAKLLQELFYIGRSEALDDCPSSAVTDGDKLYIFYKNLVEGQDTEDDRLHQDTSAHQDNADSHHSTNDQASSDQSYARFYQVNSDLFDSNQRQLQRYLATNRCGMTVGAWPHLISKVLGAFLGDAKVVEEIGFYCSGPNNQTYLCEGKSETKQGQKDWFSDDNGEHVLWRVHISETEVYALDFTGAQFSWGETIAPWFDYESRNVDSLYMVTPLGHQSHLPLQRLESKSKEHGYWLILASNLTEIALHFENKALTSEFPLPDTETQMAFNWNHIPKYPEQLWQALQASFLKHARTTLIQRVKEWNAEYDQAENNEPTYILRRWPTGELVEWRVADFFPEVQESSGEETSLPM